MNQTPHIIESSILLLAVFLLGCLVGFVLKRTIGRRPQPVSAPAPTVETETPAPEPAANPVLNLLTEPRDGKPDDLRKIKGIGPKLEALLNENGIYHYHQIAAWDAAAVAAMNERLSFRGRIEREKWVEQARALIEG